MLAPASQLFEDITDRQLAALQLALESGYYEQPRKTSLRDLADQTAVARSTYEEHLRKAENKAPHERWPVPATGDRDVVRRSTAGREDASGRTARRLNGVCFRHRARMLHRSGKPGAFVTTFLRTPDRSFGVRSRSEPVAIGVTLADCQRAIRHLIHRVRDSQTRPAESSRYRPSRTGSGVPGRCIDSGWG